MDRSEEASLTGTVTLAVSAMKGFFIINAGGILAILAYIGNVQPLYHITIELTGSINWFVGGLVLSVLTSLVTFGVQFLQTRRISSDNFANDCRAKVNRNPVEAPHWQTQAREYDETSERCFKYESKLLVVAPILGLASIAFFVKGALVGAHALTM